MSKNLLCHFCQLSPTEISQLPQSIYILFISISCNPKSNQTRKPISYSRSSIIPHKSFIPHNNFSQVSLVTPYYYILSNIMTNHQNRYINNRNLKLLNRSNKSNKTVNDLSPINNYISFILKYIHQCIHD